MTGTGRIRWTDDPSGQAMGYVGTLSPCVFRIWEPEDGDSEWLLTAAALPGEAGKRLHGSTPHDLKAEAERWLERFVSSLGAVFPEGDAIVRWQDVRGGDLVLLDDTLVTAERVTICQKPWGDGTTFTAADISHRLDNGVLVTSERHGDRYAAVRRPSAEAAVKAGEEA